jgi:hypothetical protein
MLRRLVGLGSLGLFLSACSGGGQTFTPAPAALAPADSSILSRTTVSSVSSLPTVYTKPHVLTLNAGATANPTFVLKAGDGYSGLSPVCDRGAQSVGLQIDANSTRIFNGYDYLTSTLSGQVTGVNNPTGTYHCHQTLLAINATTQTQDGTAWGFYFDIVYP